MNKKNIHVLVLLLGLAGCDKHQEPVACNLPAPTPTTPALALDVCTHLYSLHCGFDGVGVTPAADGGAASDPCQAAYADWERRLSTEVFTRVTRCYELATGCAAVQDCNLVCGEANTRVTPAEPGVDAAVPDASTDASSDASTVASTLDASTGDAGEGGVSDGGPQDGALTDAGLLDAGASDSGSLLDASEPDSSL